MRPVSRDPLEQLMLGNEEGRQLLRQLEEAAASIELAGFSASAFAQIRDAIGKIDTRLREHVVLEERYLFPFLRRTATALLSALTADHWELWREFDDLVECVRDVEEGHIHGKSILELMRGIHEFTDRLRSLGEKEAEILFPMARRVMTPSEREQLRRAMAGAV